MLQMRQSKYFICVFWDAASPVPMSLYVGHQDPFAPIETTREFAAITPGIKLHEFPERGQLLYPEWPRFLGEVRRLLEG